ncbi:MAG: hypothetical protein ACQEP7_02495 [bacterium]
MKFILNFFSSEIGQSLPEYALVVGLMSSIVFAVFIVLGPQIYDAVHKPIDQNTGPEAQQQLKKDLEADTTSSK